MADCRHACAECGRHEFRPENIAPLYANRSHFLRSQWPLPWPVYVGYRVGIALLMSIWIMTDFLEEASNFYSDNYAIWLVFATNWSFTLLGISAIVHAIIVVINYVRAGGGCTGESGADETNQGLDIPLMVFWIVYNIAFNGAIVVTVSYWAFLVSVDQAGFLVTPMSRTKHTLNTCYVLFDMMFSGIPVRIFHVVYPLFMGAIYTVFNVVYFTNDGLGPDGQPYAYYVMDWRNPLQSALTCSLGFLFTTIMQCVMYGIYRLRMCIYGYCFDVRYDDMTQTGLTGSGSYNSHDETATILSRNRTASYSSVETDQESPQHLINVYQDVSPNHNVPSPQNVDSDNVGVSDIDTAQLVVTADSETLVVTMDTNNDTLPSGSNSHLTRGKS